MEDFERIQYRSKLLDRKNRLKAVADSETTTTNLRRLMKEIDAALERIADGTFGLCKTCREPIESERLESDPLIQYCLDHLTSKQQRELEDDMVLATKIQRALLPRKSLRTAGWNITYHYEGAGPVSGDYCDFFGAADSSCYFMIGDVSGKGFSASMLMSHLQAMFRALVSLELPLDQIIERAGRLFCESTLSTHFATLVCGKATSDGAVELCNAGHVPPLIVRGADVIPLEATGLPLGMFCDEKYGVTRIQLAPRDTILLYTDGLSEAQNAAGDEFGLDRIRRFAGDHGQLSADLLVASCVEELRGFRTGVALNDDLTIMAMNRLE